MQAMQCSSVSAAIRRVETISIWYLNRDGLVKFGPTRSRFRHHQPSKLRRSFHSLQCSHRCRVWSSSWNLSCLRNFHFWKKEAAFAEALGGASIWQLVDRQGERSGVSALARRGRFFSQESHGNEDAAVANRLLSKKDNLTPRETAELEEIFLSRCNIKDPLLGVSLRKLGWLKKAAFSTISPPDSTGNLLRKVILQLRLPTRLHPKIDDLQKLLMDAAEQFITQSGIDVHVNVVVSVEPARPISILHGMKGSVITSEERLKQHERIEKLGPGLANVTHFLAVYSCKGGVGKSTIAVNLAYTLAQMGGRIGLLDVDVYGPSLPTLVHPDDPTVRQSPLGNGMVYPIDHGGVKMLSLGFVSPKSGVPGSGSSGGAAVMRGPMAGRVVSQLLKGTDWGNLDVLVLDLPPGTGDVQLTVCQELQLSGAVAVTTPSKLAIEDAKKGVEMFNALGVPTLSVVENMSFFDCEDGKRHFPFGEGIGNFLADVETSQRDFVQIPISKFTNAANDEGRPLCLSRGEEAQSDFLCFKKLANSVCSKLFRLQHQRHFEQDNGRNSELLVKFENCEKEFDVRSINLTVDIGSNEQFKVRFYSENGAYEVVISGEDLRSTDPKTGKKLLPAGERQNEIKHSTGIKVDQYFPGDLRSKKRRLFPAKIERKGHYGYSVKWADGVTTIYSMLSLALAGGGRLDT